ncbi:TatD family hydrolase [Candidatus Woesearchaeota archaeon]|nr:TatD family hydrolase [Candidatus Woesearchaeota archaeon]
MIIDIHSHLDHHYFKDDLDKVIENARKAGVKVILTAGINPETNRKVLEIAKKYDIVKACLGIYPVQYENDNKNGTTTKNNNEGVKNIKNNSSKNKNKLDIDNELKFIEKNNKSIAGIGEVGLDYSSIENNAKEQKAQFERVIQLTEKLNKLIIIHSRKAEEDCIEMLQSSKLKKVIMHCFGGRKSLVKKIIDNGWFLTAPTCITRATQFQENAKLCPITQLFCETDAPYLSPFKSKTGEFQRNEPAFIIESYKKVAEIKGMELKEVINNVWMNWQRVF